MLVGCRAERPENRKFEGLTHEFPENGKVGKVGKVSGDFLKKTAQKLPKKSGLKKAGFWGTRCGDFGKKRGGLLVFVRGLTVYFC